MLVAPFVGRLLDDLDCDSRYTFFGCLLFTSLALVAFPVLHAGLMALSGA
jgi:hypothetical protein